MDPSTLLVVFLLVTVATLASYALSHWTSIRGAFSVGWAATSLGTTLLLVAAAIVILTFVFRGPLWRPNLGADQQLRDAAASEEISQKIKASPLATTGVASVADPTTNRVARDSAGRYRPDASSAPSGSKQSSPIHPVSTQTLNGRSSQPVRSFNESDPWAATQCVYAYPRDLSEPARWKLDNDCGVPVAVIVVGGRSIVLPAPLQRPVTLDEQTVDAANYTACFVATAEAMKLIGAPSEERATALWREQFESARANDACLLRLTRYGNNVP